MSLRFTATACLALAMLAIAPRAALSQDYQLADILVPGEGWKLEASGFKFTEGPAFGPDGMLYFTDIPNQRIHRLDARGMLSAFVEPSGGANGLMFGANGQLYACQNGLKRITAFAADGSPRVLAEEVASNDLVVLGDGSIYFTDPPGKRVWLLPVGGKPRVVDEGIGRPNGIIAWPDQATVVVADSAGEHLWTFRIQPDGSLTDKAPYYSPRLVGQDRASGADGMTIDDKARLYVATKAGLEVFDMLGRSVGVIEKPHAGKLANIAFGGPALDVIYATAGDRVYSRKTKAKGVRYEPPPKP